MPIVSITIDDNAAALAARYSAARGPILQAMQRGLDAANTDTVAHIQETKLTAAGPTFLNVRTGRLRRSARATRAVISGNSVNSSLGSNVKYAASHEYGAKAHKVTASGRALKFKPKGSGKFIFRKSAQIPALPARRPFGTGLDEKLADGTYTRALSDAIRREFGR